MLRISLRVAVATAAMIATTGIAGATPVAPALAGPTVTSTGGPAPLDVAFADMNGDTRPDLVSIDSTDQTVTVLLQGTGGVLTPEPAAPAGTAQAEALAVGDVNHDGAVDVLVADGAGSVSVLLGDGTGGLGTPASVPTGGSTTFDLVAADLNTDGNLDLVAANYGSGNFSVLLGHGDATFAPATTMHVGYTTSHPFSIAVGDLNGDHRPDLAVASRGSVGTLSTFLGVGDGSFTPAGTVSSGGAHPYAVAVGDLDGDGFADVVVSDVSLSGTVTVLRSDGTGAFTSSTTTSTGGATPAQVDVADINGDRRPDVVVVNNLSATVALLSGNGDASLNPATTYDTGGSNPIGLALGRLDRDTRIDVAVANSGSGSIATFLNTTPPLLSPSITQPTAGSHLALRKTVTVRAQIRDGDGNLVADATAAALANPAACVMQLSATGVRAVAPKCMKYNARRHEFTAAFSTGRVGGSETLIATLSDPATGSTTTSSVNVTLG